MTSGEEQAYDQGWDEGYAEGQEEGYNNGFFDFWEKYQRWVEEQEVLPVGTKDFLIKRVAKEIVDA